MLKRFQESKNIKILDMTEIPTKYFSLWQEIYLHFMDYK